MSALLQRRADSLREHMDDPDCDPRRLRDTYARFGTVNRTLSGWDRVFRRWLRLPPGSSASLLDVGCGGGDVAAHLARLATLAGMRLRVSAIDPDPRALDFARSRHAAHGVEFRRTRLEELARSGETFDFVVSNHVLHHLEPEDLGAFLRMSRRVARHRVLHNDLRRSAAALAAFALFSLPFRRSYIAVDGLRSIRRAYLPDELRSLASAPWRVLPFAPYRQLLVWDAPAGRGATAAGDTPGPAAHLGSASHD